MRVRRFFILSFLLVVPLTAVIWWMLTNDYATGASPSDRSAATSAPTASAPPVSGLPQAEFSDSDIAMRQGSLRGTAVDGGVTVGANGRLVPDLQLRRLFDYYLSLGGELDQPEIRKLLARHLREQYPDSSLQADALKMFDLYIDYLQAQARMTADPDLGKQLDRLRDLRIRWLGKDIAQAFFADDEIYTRLAAERLAIRRNGSPDTKEKASSLQALDAAMPEEMQQAIAEATSAADVQAQTEQLDSSNADAATRRAARAAIWGDAAAQRLAELDTQRAQWRQRLQEYTIRSQQIRADHTLDAQKREAALNQLLQGFSAPEQHRLRALEHHPELH